MNALALRITNSTYLWVSITLIILLLAVESTLSFPLLNLSPSHVDQGEYWRLFTCNFVHFGWPHTLMNLAAFMLCAVFFLNEFSIIRLSALIAACSLAVGIGIYAWNPEYTSYAGFSGAIHGLFIAGFLLNKHHKMWVNVTLAITVFIKVIYEHQPNYQTTELQALLPVPVAYDSHLYGAFAGLMCGIIFLFMDKIQTNNT